MQVNGSVIAVTGGASGLGLATAVVGAVMIGVLPALKATSRKSTAAVQQFSGRAAGVQLGRTWTALIVLQVAIAVSLPGTRMEKRGAPAAYVARVALDFVGGER